MFIVESENQLFSLKPMNCPESTFIYRSHLRSYRDLPLRFNEYGRLHRNERSGTLSGLTRVRQFIQDDAHLYVRPDQLMDEIQALLGEVREAYWLGRPRAALRVRDQARQGDRRPGAVGARRAAHPGGVRGRRHQLRPEAQGRHVLRAQDRHLHRRRARARMADGDHPGRPDDAARAVRPDLHRRERPAAAPDRHPPRDLRLARAVHRHPGRALRRARSRSGSRRSRPSSSRSRTGMPTRPRSSPASCGRAACASRSTPRTTGCRTRSGSPRSRRCRTCSSSGDREIEARTVAPRARNAARGEQQEAVAWDDLADRLAEESARAIVSLRPSCGSASRLSPRNGLCYPPASAGTGSPCVRAGRMDTFAHTKGIDHQSRPARQPDDPDPTGSGRR